MINSLLINPKHETNKIINFLKKTFKEQKIDKVVFGLSGGIDSMTVLYLLREILPAKNIFAVQMDYFPRKKLDINLEGINAVNVSIKKIVDEFEDVVKARHHDFSSTSPRPERRGPKSLTQNQIPSLSRDESGKFFATWDLPLGEGSHGAKKFTAEPLRKERLGNIMARVRMIILFDLAKKLNAIVSGTENKSERLLGYFTRFGDSASDIEPIAHLYKTQVYQLAKYLKVPEKIINQSPTAGLWDGQTDEDEFGFTYEEADQVLYLVDDRPQDINKIKKDFPNAEKIIERMQSNQFKLQTPYHLK